MQILNKTRETTLMVHGFVANNFWLRLKGLLGKKSLQMGEGLILVNEKSIHTLFMNFAIDVIYVNKDYEVIRTDVNMVPYRLGSYVREAKYILEMPVGVIEDSATQIGDQLIFLD